MVPNQIKLHFLRITDKGADTLRLLLEDFSWKFHNYMELNRCLHKKKYLQVFNEGIVWKLEEFFRDAIL